MIQTISNAPKYIYDLASYGVHRIQALFSRIWQAVQSIFHREAPPARPPRTIRVQHPHHRARISSKGTLRGVDGTSCHISARPRNAFKILLNIFLLLRSSRAPDQKYIDNAVSSSPLKTMLVQFKDTLAIETEELPASYQSFAAPWTFQEQISNTNGNFERLLWVMTPSEREPHAGGVLFFGSGPEDLHCHALLRTPKRIYLCDFTPDGKQTLKEFVTAEEMGEYVEGKMEGKQYYRFYPYFQGKAARTGLT